jgi:hypothetical protein
MISDVITRSVCQTGPVTPPVTTTSEESPTPSGPVPTSTPVPTGGSGGDGTGTGTTGRVTTYGQVGRVPVGSVDTGDGSTAGLFRDAGTSPSADLAGQVWSTR